MNCTKHNDKEAIGACVACGSLVCEDCLVKIGDKNYCKECVIKIKERSSKINTNNNNHMIQIILSIVGIILSISFIVGFLKYMRFGNIPGNLITKEQSSIFFSYTSALVPGVILIISSIVSLFKKQGSKNKAVIILNVIAIILFIVIAKFLSVINGEPVAIKFSVILRMIVINVVTFINALRD